MMAFPHWPTSKQLYLMNGGNKVYIYRDGFGDIYEATALEEAEWAKEVIAGELIKIDEATNLTTLQFAIENLAFHHVQNLKELLIDKISNAVATRQVAFAVALWKLFRYQKSFEVLHDILLRGEKEDIPIVFLGLAEIRNNAAANMFILSCLRADDEEIYKRAYTTVGMWSYTGLAQLRENHLVERLGPGNRHTSVFDVALQELAAALAVHIIAPEP